MRLTDDVFIKSDDCTYELIRTASMLYSGGNFGLIPNIRPFSLSLDIKNDTIEVVEIDCLGITRDGSLIDVHYDTYYTKAYDTKITIPDSSIESAFILCISATNEWRDTNDGMCEQVYSYYVIEEDTSVPANALPVARIVYDQQCWRMDDINFVPPCLFIKSFVKYVELYDEFKNLLEKLDSLLPQKLVTENREALKIYWPIVQQLMITVDKNRDYMSPMSLLGNVQKCVSGFILACSLDEYITLNEPEAFMNFVYIPYNFKNAYQTIKEGLELCSSICIRIEGFSGKEQPNKQKQHPLPTPSISPDQLNQKTKTGKIKIRVGNTTDGSTLFYSVDGSNPSIPSAICDLITIDAHFKSDKNPEPDKQIVVKLMSEMNGVYSQVSAYKILIHKDYKSYICI